MSSGKPIKNLAASIRTRLLNNSKRQGIDFNRMLLIYFQQCFLERLSHSKYNRRFILKGGLLFYGLEPLLSRPTKDIDLLGKGLRNQPEKIAEILQEILAIELPDGVIFLTKNMRYEIIAERKAYSGVRVFIPAELNNARHVLQIDIGFGDTIVPAPVSFDFPSLLKDKSVKLFAYSWSSVIAEKFEAIVRFGDLSSRMKDYYDIFYLQNKFDFDGKELSTAIRITFNNRESDFSALDHIFSERFAMDKQKQWLAFLFKNNLQEPSDFFQVIQYLRKFLSPIVSAIIRKENFSRKWDSSKKQWL